MEWLTRAISFFWIASLLAIVSLTVLRGPFDEAGRVTFGYSKGGLEGARAAAVNIIGPAFGGTLRGWFGGRRLLDDRQPDMPAFGPIATRMNEALGLIPAWLAGLVISLAALFVPGASPLRGLSPLSGKGGTGLCRSVRVPSAVSAAAPGNEDVVTGPDVVRAQYLYAIACLLVFASVAVDAALR